MAWPAIGRAFSPAEFEAYVRGLSWKGTFHPLFITLHNTACPSLAQRPAGLTKQHILNLQSYYRDEKGWKGGPHLFIDDCAIWVFNDLTKFGTHSPSWNSVAIGIEMLGDFECESFTEGRGRRVRDNTVAAMAILNKALGFPADSFKFHIEDKKTNHACPGKLARAERAALVAEIEAAMAAGTPSPLVGEGEGGGESGTAAADALPTPNPTPTEGGEVAEASMGIFSNCSFAKINSLADEGSRLAVHIRNLKAWFWKLLGFGTATGTVVATADTTKGTAQIAASHPNLLLVVLGVLAGALLIGGLGYLYVKFRLEPHLLSAAKDKRYSPRGLAQKA